MQEKLSVFPGLGECGSLGKVEGKHAQLLTVGTPRKNGKRLIQIPTFKRQRGKIKSKQTKKKIKEVKLL